MQFKYSDIFKKILRSLFPVISFKVWFLQNIEGLLSCFQLNALLTEHSQFSVIPTCAVVA